MHNKQAGFTLMEVMVALAIFALLSLSLYSATGYVMGHHSGLNERALAHWLADNHLNEIRAGMLPGESRQMEPTRFAGRDWLVDISIGSAPDARLKQIVIHVFSGGANPKQRARLIGYVEANR